MTLSIPERWPALWQQILETPDDPLYRMILADELEAAGECDRAAFIVVQCELASLPPEPLMTCSGQTFRSHREAERHSNKCAWCQWTYIRDAKILPLRAREARLLAATSAEPCPRVLHGGSGYPGEACELDSHGPDYWTATLYSPDEIIVGERIDLIGRVNLGTKKHKFYGLVISKVLDEQEGRVVLKRDELSVPGPNVVQVSNAIRWAGPLGNRPMSALLGNINAGGDRHVGHVSWNGADTEGSTIYGRFRLGLLSEISLSCAALVGEQCGRCEGRGEYGIRRTEIGPTTRRRECGQCHGSGRVNSLAADLGRFPLLPDSGVVLSDKRPAEWTNEDGTKSWVWVEPDRAHDGRHTVPMSHDLPPEIFDRLEGGILNNREWVQRYSSPALALRALSRAACGWIREQVKELVRV